MPLLPCCISRDFGCYIARQEQLEREQEFEDYVIEQLELAAKCIKERGRDRRGFNILETQIRKIFDDVIVTIQHESEEYI